MVLNERYVGVLNNIKTYHNIKYKPNNIKSSLLTTAPIKLCTKFEQLAAAKHFLYQPLL